MRRRLALVALALLLLTSGGHDRGVVAAIGRLVKTEPMGFCAIPADQVRALRRTEGASSTAASVIAPQVRAFIDPTRKVRDAYPAFAAVAVDMTRDEVVFTDENLFQILVYDRTENTPAGVPASRPKRIIVGPNTDIEFQSGLYVDQKTGDIFAPNNDTRDTLVVFKHGSSGDSAPIRRVETPHGTFGALVDEAHDELFMTEQHDSAIVVYRKDATQEESPVRYLQGAHTGLQDPHGIALDPRGDVIFVANYGYTHDVAFTDKPKTGVNQAGNRDGKSNWPLGREFAVPGSGTINAPSITVYMRSASGDAAPLRTIRGPDTGLNWPTGLAFDSVARELFVANDAAHEVLVFDAAASGNVKPTRRLKGPRTKLANPTSVFADTKNRELWVANFGGHSATVYDLAASGDAVPKRIIRNAPEGTPSLMIGNPGAVGYDSKREQILVPN